MTDREKTDERGRERERLHRTKRHLQSALPSLHLPLPPSLLAAAINAGRVSELNFDAATFYSHFRVRLRVRVRVPLGHISPMAGLAVARTSANGPTTVVPSCCWSVSSLLFCALSLQSEAEKP